MIRTAILGLLAAGMVFAAPVEAKNPHAEDSGSATTQRNLPPGLQKKIARGGELPPGWERKLQVGKPMEDDLYQRSEPVSDSIKATLPVGPAGTIEVQLDGKVVRLYKATREIAEIFELDKLQSRLR